MIAGYLQPSSFIELDSYDTESVSLILTADYTPVTPNRDGRIHLTTELEMILCFLQMGIHAYLVKEVEICV